MTRAHRFPNQDPDVHGTSAMTAGLPRRVSIKACNGVEAAVVVTVVQGAVWLSIRPFLTWEAIIEPGQIDQVIRVLELAREEAGRTVMSVRP